MIKAMWAPFAAVALLVACASASSSGLAVKRAASVCNGYSELCSKQYSNVTHIGAHDSYSVGSMSSVGTNQELDVTDQLKSGIRALQIQGHSEEGSASGISLCHTDCSIRNGGTLESYLGNVTQWVKENPNDVVTIFIANNDNLPAAQWGKGFSSAGLEKYTYAPAGTKVSKNNWPQLKDMINKNQRVVVFMDYKADTSAVKYILPEFSNVFEDPYDQQSTPFNCTADRFNGDTSHMMYLHNHFLDKKGDILGKSYLTPDTSQLNKTNSVDSIMSNAASCAKKHDSYPTFILFDFFDQGNGSVFEAAAQMNNVQYQATPISSSSDSNSNSASSMHPGLPYLGGLFALALGWVALIL
ncbi:uncharacterized protein MJAP1_002637 [Malassezia japonica]|uniref:PLC-like phosphodiesterase n=1 Tax=Malassezia japonica TaxID=223818 RepID=A0AAF0JAC6_9BASI|nr:uncharacterized protein MJAP1_002637 [Malassezia japonica]WFD39657.1 hypothetical protein MJAP1_002637 [Malassezia japonica]